MFSTRIAPGTALQGPTASASNAPLWRLLAAQLIVLACTLVFEHTVALVPRPSGRFTEDVFYMRELLRFYVTLIGAFSVSWLLHPVAEIWLARPRPQRSPAARAALTAVALAGAALFTSWFLIHFGRHQFGSWDYGILIDTGYRGLLGQRPYVDFLTPTPPFFNWTSTLAFRIFGLSWDATLFFAAAFSTLTLLWCFSLLRTFGLQPLAALATAFAVQTAAMLSCCFWWYNNSTLVLAALFFLACLTLVRRGDSRFAQLSFVLLLGVLPLTKPNIAGVTVLGCLFLSFCTVTRPRRLALLSLAGAGVTVLLLLALHVAVAGMLTTYRSVARERGGFSTFGFNALSIGERQMTVLWLLGLCIPLLGLVPRLRADLQARHWRAAAFWLFFPLAAAVAVCGVAGNGEFRDVECTLLIIALAVLAFDSQTGSLRLRRLTVAHLCGLCAADLYAGAKRQRVYTIRPHIFFEWRNTNDRIDTGFLRNLTASGSLVEADAEIRYAVRTNPGPLFFGPRLDFEYAALGLPSPAHWVTFFQPGTAFGREQTPAVLQNWQDHHFQTLIFLKDEYFFYPEGLKAFMRSQYLRDDAYARITVWRRRPCL